MHPTYPDLCHIVSKKPVVASCESNNFNVAKHVHTELTNAQDIHQIIFWGPVLLMLFTMLFLTL